MSVFCVRTSSLLCTAGALVMLMSACSSDEADMATDQPQQPVSVAPADTKQASDEQAASEAPVDEQSSNTLAAQDEAGQNQELQVQEQIDQQVASQGSRESTEQEKARTRDLNSEMDNMVRRLEAVLTPEQAEKMRAEQERWHAQNFACPRDRNDAGHHACMQYHIMARMEDLKGRHQQVGTGQIN